MRTLALLAALLLLALQAQAELPRETADLVPAQDLPETKDQDQLEAEDQDMAISFGGADRLARDASGLRKRTICYCRRSSSCHANERYSGTCTLSGIRYILCCR